MKNHIKNHLLLLFSLFSFCVQSSNITDTVPIKYQFSLDGKTGKITPMSKAKTQVPLKFIRELDYFKDDSKDNLIKRGELRKLRSDLLIQNNIIDGVDDKNRFSGYSGIGDIISAYSYDKNYLVIGVGAIHGGFLNEVCFFDNNKHLLNRFKLTNELTMPYIDFNPDGTYVCVSSGVSGDFYIFTNKGELVRKGNFNKLTGDPGTSYLKNLISQNGEVWLLANNDTWLYDKNGKLIVKLKTIVSNGYLDDKNHLLVYIKENKSLDFYDYKLKKTLYTISLPDYNPYFEVFENKMELFLHKNKKLFEYELPKK